MRTLGVGIFVGVIAGASFAFPPAAFSQSPPPVKAAAPLPSEPRAKAVSASTVKQIIERYKKGYELPYVLCKTFESDLPAWRVAAGKNDPNGQLILGLCNYYGIGGKQNRDRGFDLIKKAADKGNADAMAMFAILLKNGDMDHAPSIDECLLYLKRASDEAHPLAQDQLVINQSDYFRIIGNYDEAVALLEQAALDGNLNAMCKLGQVKLDGWMQPLESELGIQLLQRAAAGGHVVAMTELAQVYAEGDYIAANPAAAQAWVEKAATTGCTDGLFTAALLYERGALTGKRETERAKSFWKQLESSPDPKASLALFHRYNGPVRASDKDFDTQVTDRAIDAATRGVPEAYQWASRIFRLGSVKYPKDLERARVILQHGVAALNPNATFEMALAHRYGYFEAANEEKAIGLFSAAAALGVAEAMTAIGERYYLGRGMPRDLKQAYRCYLSGAFAGDPESMYAISRACILGEGVDVNAKQAEFWAQQAIMRGYADGYFMLYEMCRLGVGRPANQAEGVPLLMKGGKEGGRICSARVGELLIEGTVVPRDVEMGLSFLEMLIPLDRDGSVRVSLAGHYLGRGVVPANPQRSLELAQQAADLGNSDAWALLGFIKATGIVGEQNWGDAVDCYSKSISLGNAHAMLNLGSHYLEGKVTPRDPERAIELWTDAVEQQSMPQATVYLTKAYFGFFGKEMINEAEAIKWAEKAIELKQPEVCAIAGSYYSLNTDYVSARQWFQRGIDLGEDVCCNEMGVLYRYGRGVEQSDVEAVRYYRMGHERGNLLATSNLASCYEDGKGVPQDLAESMRLAQFAADNGDPTAMLFIGRKYVDGIGVPRNFDKGIEWIRKAANAGDITAKNMIAGATEKGLIK